MRSPTHLARFVAAARGLVGLVLVTRPDRVLGVVAPGSQGKRTRRAVRILGVRHVVESAVLIARPSINASTLVAGADTVHALSMVALAVASPRNRRLGAAASAAAGLMCVSTILTRGRAPGRVTP